MSRNFFSSWRETREQLREYYIEPARTSKLLGLERLAQGRGENGVEIPQNLRELMVERLLEEFAADARVQREHRQGRGRSGPKDAAAEAK